MAIRNNLKLVNHKMLDKKSFRAIALMIICLLIILPNLGLGRNIMTASVQTSLSDASEPGAGVKVQDDKAQVSNDSYELQEQSFGVIGSTAEEPALTNFFWFFGNESIGYVAVLPSEAVSLSSIESFGGLVLWTRHGGYNPSVIRQFAQTHVVIADIRDFCTILYPNLNSSLQTVNSNTVTYDTDWGNFQTGDVVDVRNETGNTDYLTGVLASALSQFPNVTSMARFDSSTVASFLMNGTVANSGFFVMDLDSTTPESDWNGIWPVFPAVKMVQSFPTGTYAEWMGNGQNWQNLTWVYNRVDEIVNQNNDIARKIIIGQSVDNRNIPAIIIGNGSKNAIIDGSIHGNEKTGTFACLRIAELLIQYYRSDPYWQTKLTQYKVIIVPVVNPDGFVDNTRENAHGVNLNRQFPPLGTTTEPEAWALRNLMGNYKPMLYVNMHEGSYFYPLHMIYGAYLNGTNLTLTTNALQQANQTFAGLNEYGWFTDGGSHIWVGKVDTIVRGGGEPGMASDYASYAYNASSTILETFVWSDTYGAKQSLWALDYYPAVTIAFLQHYIGISGGTTYPRWDLNQDGVVDLKDFVILANAYGATAGSPNWNPLADIYGEGKIDLLDLRILALHYGQRYN